MRATAVVISLLVLTATGHSQLFFTDQGMLSGSGLTVLPTAGTTPMGHWRIVTGRMEYLGGGMKGMNVFGLNYGLSGYVEGYVRLTAEQTGAFSSLTTYGFGGKMIVPVSLPNVLRTGLWFESTGADEARESMFFPPNAVRGGISTAFGTRPFSPLLLAGMTSVDGRAHPLVGGGFAAALTNSLQVGVEVVRGYAAESGMHYLADAACRVVPYASVFVGGGYMTAPGGSTWTVTMGIALTTVGIDFNPVMDIKGKDEYRLPTIEELMNQPTGSGTGDEVPEENAEKSISEHQEPPSDEDSHE